MTRLPLKVALSLALSATLLAPSLALADEPSAADKETARALLIDGRDKLGKKDYEGALKSLKAAHAIMNVPTTGLDYALALEALGQLIEARSVALAVTRLPPRMGEPEAFADARASATVLAERLATRVATVVITVKGLPAGVEPTLTLDGAPLPAATIGLPRKVDPGAHVIAASAPGFATAEKRVELRETATLPVELTLQSGVPGVKGPPGVTQAPTTRGTRAPSSPVADEPPPPPPRRVPTWAWVSGGAGVVALGASIGFAVDYGNVRSAVTSACPNDTCQGHLPAQLGHWNRDLGLFVGLGAVSVAALATALVGVVRKPGAPQVSAVSAMFSPWLAPPTAGHASGHASEHASEHDGGAAGGAFTGAF
jgi:hypothetical protein